MKDDDDESNNKIIITINSSLLGIIDLNRLPCWLRGKKFASQCRRCRFNPWVGKIPWRRKWQLTSVFLPGKSHGQRSLVGSMGSQRVRHDLATKPPPHRLGKHLNPPDSPVNTRRESMSQELQVQRLMSRATVRGNVDKEGTGVGELESVSSGSRSSLLLKKTLL